MIKTDRWEQNPEFYENVPSRFTPLGDVAVGEDIADAFWYFAEHASNTTGAEITFRTAYAKEAIEYAIKNHPEMSIGALTDIRPAKTEFYF